MQAPNTRFFAFVARFVDAVSTEALTTELHAQRQARMSFEAARRDAARQAAVVASAREAA